MGLEGAGCACCVLRRIPGATTVVQANVEGIAKASEHRYGCANAPWSSLQVEVLMAGMCRGFLVLSHREHGQGRRRQREEENQPELLS